VLRCTLPTHPCVDDALKGGAMSVKPFYPAYGRRRVQITLKYDFSAQGGGLYLEFDRILTQRSAPFMVFATTGYVRKNVDGYVLVYVLHGLLSQSSGIEHVNVMESSLTVFNDGQTSADDVIALLDAVLRRAGYLVNFVDELRQTPPPTTRTDDDGTTNYHPVSR